MMYHVDQRCFGSYSLRHYSLLDNIISNANLYHSLGTQYIDGYSRTAAWAHIFSLTIIFIFNDIDILVDSILNFYDLFLTQVRESGNFFFAEIDELLNTVHIMELQLL